MPEWLFGKSIKTQLIVFLFALTTIAVGVVGFLGVRAVLDSGGKSEKITAKATEQRVQQILTQTTNATANRSSLIFNNVESEAVNAGQYYQNILENPTNFVPKNWHFDTGVHRTAGGSWGNSATETGSIYLHKDTKITPQLKSYMEQTTYLDYMFPNILKNDPNTVAVYITGPNGETRYYPNIDLASFIDPSFNPLDADFASAGSPTNDAARTIQWTKVYDDPAGHGLLITTVYPVYTSKDTFAGTIGIDVSLTEIGKTIADYSPIESSYAFLVDDAGRSIALPTQGYRDLLGRDPKKDEFGTDLSKVNGGLGQILQKMRKQQGGFSVAAAKGKENLYVAYAPVPGTKFSLAIAAKQSTMLRVVDDLRDAVKSSSSRVFYTQILPIGLCLLALVWAIGFVYIGFITGPIIALTDKTTKLMRGDFKQHMQVNSKNEVGKLGVAFNNMAQQLEASYETLERKVKELGDAKAKDDAILTSIGDGVIVTDQSGKVLFANTFAASLLDTRLSKMQGMKMDSAELYSESGKLIDVKDRPAQLSLRTSKKARQSMNFKRKDGSMRALDVVATPVVQHGELIGVIQIVRDVTKEREIDRMKTDFISIASHQLRTPLSAIKWLCELLVSGDAGKLKDDQAGYATDIAASTERMIELVDSLLNISRIESGRIIIDPKPTDLSELVQTIAKDLSQKVKDKKQSLTVSVDKSLPKVNVDGQLIRQVYINLLTNSIKYTPEGGQISINITSKKGKIISEITDNGMGIPKTQQHKIFERFFRADNVRKVETDGNGLGMYLVKAIVDSSGGEIEFVSNENKGTTFRVSLPLTGMKAKEGDFTIGQA